MKTLYGTYGRFRRPRNGCVVYLPRAPVVTLVDVNSDVTHRTAASTAVLRGRVVAINMRQKQITLQPSSNFIFINNTIT